MRKRTWMSKQQLLDHGLYLTINEKGKYGFWQKRDNWKEAKPLNVYSIVSEKKYGDAVEYPAVSVYMGKTIHPKTGKTYYKQRPLLLHVFVWLWFNNEIPEGWVDVDHINNNKLNFRIENLQLLTRKENLEKRGYVRNQYCRDNTDEEILAKRQKAIEKKEALAEYKQIRDENLKIIADLKLNNKDNKYAIKVAEKVIADTYKRYKEKYTTKK